MARVPRANIQTLLLGGSGLSVPSREADSHTEVHRPKGSEPTRTAFVLTGVSKSYGAMESLKSISLRISVGERVAIIGPSGAGKTTLLRLLNTSLFPSRGTLNILGSNPLALKPAKLRKLRGRIGSVFQQLLLVPQVSVLQNVIAGQLSRTPLWKAALALVSTAESERVHAVLEKVGIGSKIYERVDRLSGGEQQRVAIARTLYQNPEVLIADEPVSWVDPTRSLEVLELLARAAEGRTLVISTNRPEALLPWVSRVIGVRQGSLVFDKPTGDVTVDDFSQLYSSVKAAPAPQAPRSLSPQVTSAAGAVMVGASNTPGEFMLPRVVPAFVKAFPGVRVGLALKDTKETIRDLVEGRVDIAFLGARDSSAQLHFEDFADDEIILVASPSLSLPAPILTPSEVAQLARVEREPGSGTRAVVEDYFSNRGTPLNPAAIALEVGSLVGLKAAVISGIGIAFSSRLAVTSELASGVLREVPVQSVRIRRLIFVAWRMGGLTPQAKGFLQVSRQIWSNAAEEMAE